MADVLQQFQCTRRFSVQEILRRLQIDLCRWVQAHQKIPLAKSVDQPKISWLFFALTVTIWLTCSSHIPTKAFFIVTQVLYTAGFLLLVLVCAGIVAVQQCFIIEREDYALRALSIASLLSGVSCTSAVIIFTIYGNRDDWMPDSDHNYFSWSYAAAVIGSILLWIAALLFYIEMQLTLRREMRQRSSHSPR